MKTPYQNQSVARFLNSVCFAALLVPALTGAAQTQIFTDRAAWSAYVGATPTDIDFTTRDDGSPITDPVWDVLMSPLSLRCVDFLEVRSYWNLLIYVYPLQVLRVDLPAGTYAFGTDLLPFYNYPGSYTVRLSTGEVFPVSPSLTSWDFFGVSSPVDISWVEFSYDNDSLALDNFSFVPGQPCLTAVTIDIKPDSTKNPVNPRSKGRLPVAVFGGPALDPYQIDVASLRLGVTGQEAAPSKQCFLDVNGDGDVDLLLHFRVPDTGMSCTTTQLMLTGQLLSGQLLSGTDNVKPVGCKR